METTKPIFDEIELYGLLKQVNPWWKNERVSGELPELKRQAFYDVLKTLTHPDIRRFAILSGARRVGKTTVMRQVIAHLLEQGVPAENILYVPFDRIVFRLSGFRAIWETYKTVHRFRGKCYYFLDDIQNIEDSALWMKTLYDQNPEIEMMATSSSLVRSEFGHVDCSVGRWRELVMPTMLFREYCELQGVHPVEGELPGIEAIPEMSTSDFSKLMKQLSGLTPHWYHYLQQGGFPELLKLKDEETVYSLLREDVVDKVLKRDVPSLFDVRNPVQLEKIFLYLCLHCGSIFNLDTMSSALGTSKPTLSRYMSYLQDANLIYVSRNLCATGKKGLSAQPKIYIADVAMRNASLMRYAPMSNETDMGLMAECTVYKHFHSVYAKYGDVGFMRSGAKGKNEIDIAVEQHNGKRILCEVKYRNDSELSAQDAIISACRKGQNDLCLLATKSPHDFGRIEPPGSVPLFRIPSAALCYLL